MGKGVGQLGAGLARIGTIGATVAVAGLGAVVKTAISFESAFAGVRKTVDATDIELSRLRQGFKDMTREIPLSFEELAGIGEQAGALGIAKQDILEFTRVVALIGTTTDVASDEAATSLGQLSNVLGLVAADYDNFGATLVDLGNKGASTESQILGLASRAGAGAHLIGIASDATLGWASSVANLGIEVEAGGSALQKFFLDSLQNIQKSDTLKLMAKTAGLTGAAYKQAFEKDASGALVKFIQGLGKLKQAEQLAVLEGLGFNDVRITRTLLGLAGDTDNLTDSLNVASVAWKENTALTIEAQKRFETTESQLKLLKEGIRGAGDTIGSALLPKLTPLIGDLNKFLTDHEADIATFGQKLADGLAIFADKLKTVDFSGVIGGLKILGDVGKKVVDIFLSLPKGVQGALVAGFAVNKLSGGLLGRGVGNIAGGLLKVAISQFGTRGSGPQNPVWVQSATGGVGGPGIIGGAGSIITKLLGVTTAVGLGAILGNAIGKALFFDPTVRPAVEFEETQFRQLVEGPALSTSELSAKLAALNEQLVYLKGGSNPLQQVLAGALFGDQIAILEDQRTTLEGLLAEAQTSHPEFISEFKHSRATSEELYALAVREAARATQEEAAGRALTRSHESALAVSEAGARELARSAIANQSATAERLERLLEPLPSGINALVAKPWSTTVNIATTVNAQLSVTSALRTETIVGSIRYDGKPLPLN